MRNLGRKPFQPLTVSWVGLYLSDLARLLPLPSPPSQVRSLALYLSDQSGYLPLPSPPPSQVRLLLGFVRRGFLQKLYEQTQVQPGSSKVWKLVCALESRLAMFALRMGLAHDILAANVVLRRKVSGGVDSGGALPPGKREISVEH